MTRILTAITTAAMTLALLFCGPGAQAAGDEFGSNFTAETPAGLADPQSGMDFAADVVNNIEPAAGEEVWVAPEDGGPQGEAATVPGTDLLVNPLEPVIPGQEPAKNAGPTLPGAVSGN